MEENQVTLKITSDYGFTADFLRDLANQIEEEGESLTTFELPHGCAEIEWHRYAAFRPDSSSKHRWLVGVYAVCVKFHSQRQGKGTCCRACQKDGYSHQ